MLVAAILKIILSRRHWCCKCHFGLLTLAHYTWVLPTYKPASTSPRTHQAQDTPGQEGRNVGTQPHPLVVQQQPRNYLVPANSCPETGHNHQWASASAGGRGWQPTGPGNISTYWHVRSSQPCHNRRAHIGGTTRAYSFGDQRAV